MFRVFLAFWVGVRGCGVGGGCLVLDVLPAQARAHGFVVVWFWLVGVVVWELHSGREHLAGGGTSDGVRPLQ